MFYLVHAVVLHCEMRGDVGKPLAGQPVEPLIVVVAIPSSAATVHPRKIAHGETKCHDGDSVTQHRWHKKVLEHRSTHVRLRNYEKREWKNVLITFV